MNISVIMPVYNEEETISEQLEALTRQNWKHQWEVIVADNGSTDDTLNVVKKYKDRLPSLRVVDASDKKGRPHALNIAVAVAEGEALVFCDSDDVVDDDWLMNIGEALEKYDFVASRFEVDKLNGGDKQGRRTDQENGLQQYRYPPFLPHAGGCGLGVKKWLHNQVGGYNEKMIRLADTDYCWKIQLQGVKLHFVPTATIHIRFRDSVGSTYKQTFLWAEYNVLLYKMYRPHGMPKLSFKEGIGKWIGLLRSVGKIRNPNERAEWLWTLIWRSGRLYGSIKHRVLAL